MCALPAGRRPAEKDRALIARMAAAVFFAALGGCASTQNAAQNDANAMRMAHAATDVESDGLPSQTPPPARIRQLPDDPSEPFSRNYGGINPSASAAPLSEGPSHDEKPAPHIPLDLPPAFREKLVAAMNADE